MVEYDNIRNKLNELLPGIEYLNNALDIDGLKNFIEEKQNLTIMPGFWDDADRSKKIMQEIGSAQNKLDGFMKLKLDYYDVVELTDIADAEEDLSFLDDITATVKDVEERIAKLKVSTLLDGEYDASNAIFTFHSGAGGTEAQDWVQMLLRMYTMWANKHGLTAKVADVLDGDDAGIKRATVIFEGENAYGYLKGEAGVHRLVRISPFDASGRRHTSFAAIEIMPEIDDTVEVNINEDDLRIDVYRSSGAGGQHINKTSSAVRITHIPSGIVVACQNERSQHQNKDMAMKMLKSKLVEIKEKEHLEKIEDIKGVKQDNAWGSQIRSYVFMPYTLVKDHRTGYENGNVDAVMDGDLDGFINAYLMKKD